MNHSSPTESPWIWHRPHEVHVWSARVDQWLDRLAEFSSWLDADEQARAARYRFPEHRDQYVLGRGLLRGLLGRYLEREPRHLSLAAEPLGKPYWRRDSGDPQLEFNLSNSHGHILLAFSRCGPVGVDVEQIRPLDDLPGLARRYFAKEEQADLEALSEAERRSYFFTLWTLKEAFLKGTGTGLSTPLDSFFVRPIFPRHPDAARQPSVPQAPPGDVDSSCTSYSLTIRGVPQHRWNLCQIPCATGFAAALAVEGELPDGGVRCRSVLAV